MKHDPEIDGFICLNCHIEQPLTYDKLKQAASVRGLKLLSRMEIRGPRYMIEHANPDPATYYKTCIAAYREGLIRWIINNK